MLESSTQIAAPVPEEKQQVRPPAPAKWGDWFRAGFFAALGVAALAVLALTMRHVLEAALGIATPFIFGTVFTLLLDPVVKRLQTRGLSRGMGVVVVFGLFLFFVIGIGWLAIPALANQANQLAQEGPRYLAELQKYTNDFLAHHRKILGIKMPKNFNAISAQITAQSSGLLSGSTTKITAFLLGSITTLLEIVVTLIVTFYLLLDIDRMRARLFYLAPKRWRSPMHLFARDIGRVFSDYLRGLLIVSALYGLMTLLLLLGLSIMHSELLQYALLVAAAGGILYSVPYLGPLVTALITFLVAFAAGGIEFGIGAIIATLILNQIFDNVITPRVVGGGVGLHPVMSLFALSLGGAMFGLWGLLLSVPVAASIQAILLRLFPKLSTPTAEYFLREQGVPIEEESEEEQKAGAATPAPNAP